MKTLLNLSLGLLFITTSLLFFEGCENKAPQKEDLVSAKLTLALDSAWVLVDNKPQAALIIVDQVLVSAQELNKQAVTARALSILGTIKKNFGEYEEAKKNYYLCLKIRQEIGDSMGVANTFYNIGVILVLQGNYPEALENYQKAMTIYTQIKADKMSVSDLNNNIGMIFAKQGDNKRAFDYYSKNLEIINELLQEKPNELEYKISKAVALNNIGEIFRKKGQYQEAINHYLETLKIYEKINDQKSLANSYNNIGFTYKNMGYYASALVYYKKSLSLSRNLNNPKFIGHNIMNMSFIYREQKKFSEAEKLLLEAFKIAKTIEDADLMTNVYSNLALLYASQEDYKKAYEYKDLSATIHDSIAGVETGQTIAKMNAQYENERKEKEIVLLSKDQELAQAQIARQRIVITLVVFGALIVLLRIFLIYRAYRHKKKTNLLLNKKNLEIEIKNKEIEKQKSEIERHQKDIIDSINYARRIQQAAMPPLEDIRSALPNSFILYKPKDIVSGDFYWFYKNADGSILMAAADCTGHGVPGAFMSLIGLKQLYQAAKQSCDLGLILQILNQGVKELLHQNTGAGSTRDGMDIALVKITFLQENDQFSRPLLPSRSDGEQAIPNFQNIQLEYAGANRPLWIIRQNSSNLEIEEIKPDKIAIGGTTDINQSFNVQKLKLGPKDRFYIFSDGFVDQFGGPRGKKLMTRGFREEILSIQDKSIEEQARALDDFIEKWKSYSNPLDENKSYEQLDDILVIGFKNE